MLPEPDSADEVLVRLAAGFQEVAADTQAIGAAMRELAVATALVHAAAFESIFFDILTRPRSPKAEARKP